MRTAPLIVALLLVAVAFGPRPAAAEPFLMVRQGAKCSACHTNQTGGGKRTAFANIHARDILHDRDFIPIPAGVKPFRGEINQYLSIGADLRVANIATFEDKPNAAGRVPENRAFRSEVVTNELELNEFIFYGQVDLWPDLVTLYVDEDFTSGATNREALALIRGFLPWETYFKGGRLFPAFGLRVADDEAFVRARTGFTFDGYDEGAEIGTGPGPFFFATSVTNGTQGDTDALIAMNGYGVFEDIPIVRNVVAGGSFARQSRDRNVCAFYAGSNLWKFTYLGEFDLIDDDNPPVIGKGRDQFASYAEVNLLLLDWLNFKWTFDFVKVSGDRNQTRYTIAVNPFISRFLQPSLQYRINNAPGNEPTLNQDQLWLELHLFF